MSRSHAADQFYTRWARLYDYVSRRTPGVAALRKETVDRMALEPGMTVLDMGCGPGPNVPFVRRTVGPDGTILGIDVATGALDRAQQSNERAGWKNVHVARADATRPPVEETDAIIAAFVIGMFENPAEVVDDWCDLVGSGGRIGLLHFARSERWYGRLPNVALRTLVILSTPGKRRFSSDATNLLDRRVIEGHAQLIERATTFEHTTRWGGLVHVMTATIE